MPGVKQKMKIMEVVEKTTKDIQIQKEKYQFEIDKINSKIEKFQKEATEETQKWVDGQIKKLQEDLAAQTKGMQEWLDNAMKEVNAFKEEQLKKLQESLAKPLKAKAEIQAELLKEQLIMQAIPEPADENTPVVFPEKKEKTQEEKDAEELAKAKEEEAKKKAEEEAKRKEKIKNFNLQYTCHWAKEMDGDKFVWDETNSTYAGDVETALAAVKKLTKCNSMEVDELLDMEKDVLSLGLKRISHEKYKFEGADKMLRGMSTEDKTQILTENMAEMEFKKWAETFWRNDLNVANSRCVDGMDTGIYDQGPCSRWCKCSLKS